MTHITVQRTKNTETASNHQNSGRGSKSARHKIKSTYGARDQNVMLIAGLFTLSLLLCSLVPRLSLRSLRNITHDL